MFIVLGVCLPDVKMRLFLGKKLDPKKLERKEQQVYYFEKYPENLQKIIPTSLYLLNSVRHCTLNLLSECVFIGVTVTVVFFL